MKAKHLKQHTTKYEVEEDFDKWENKGYVVAGVSYTTEAEAKEAIRDLIRKEFTARFKK